MKPGFAEDIETIAANLEEVAEAQARYSPEEIATLMKAAAMIIRSLGAAVGEQPDLGLEQIILCRRAKPERFSGTFWNPVDSGSMIRPPKSNDYPDRGLDAEVAIETEFNRLAGSAEDVGWTREEAAHALLNLAVAHMLAIEANQDTDEAIARAARSVHGLVH